MTTTTTETRTRTRTIDMLLAKAPHLKVIGDKDDIDRELAECESAKNVKPATVASAIAGMADATHIYGDHDGSGHCLVLFRASDGTEYEDGDPWDWRESHTLGSLIDERDTPETSHRTCPVCRRHVHYGIDQLVCVYHYQGWNDGRSCGQHVHAHCAKSYRGGLGPSLCPDHWHEDEYKSPYDGKPWYHSAFTFGLEVEVDGTLDVSTHDMLRTSPLMAGYCADGSLRGAGLEYHTQPLTMADLDQLVSIVADINPNHRQRRSGGHMHVRRTGRQTPSRWYWALKAFTADERMRTLAWEQYNMRHVLGSESHDNASESSYWCPLVHGRYSGKHTAVNGDHSLTIELRTFGRWDHDTAPRLANAIRWAHHMWRYFQANPPRSLAPSTIIDESTRYALQLTAKPMWMVKGEYRRRMLEMRREDAERERQERVRRMRERILDNIKADKRARRGHWKRYRRIAERERDERLKAKRERRNLMESRLANPYAWTTVWSFSPIPRLDAYHAIIDGKLTTVSDQVIVRNPATGEIVQTLDVPYATRKSLTGRHRDVRVLSRAIRLHAPAMYTREQAMRIYRRIARNHGIDLEPVNIGNRAVRRASRGMARRIGM